MVKIKGALSGLSSKISVSSPFLKDDTVHQLLQQRAEKRSGIFNDSLLDGKYFTFSYLDFDITVRYFIDKKTRSMPQTKTIIQTVVKSTMDIKFSIYSNEHGKKLFSHGMETIQTDNNDFNKKFIVQCTDISLIQSFLCQEIQEKLLSLADDFDYPEINLMKETFSMIAYNCFYSEKEYDDFIDTALLVLKKIRESGIIKE